MGDAGCAGSNDTLACLRGVPAEVLKAAMDGELSGSTGRGELWSDSRFSLPFAARVNPKAKKLKAGAAEQQIQADDQQQGRALPVVLGADLRRHRGHHGRCVVILF